MHRRLIIAAVLAAVSVLLCLVVVDWYTSRVVLDAYRGAVVRLTDIAKGYYLDCKHELEAETARLAAGFRGAEPVLLADLADLAGLTGASAGARMVYAVSENGETIWLYGPQHAGAYNDFCDDLMLQTALDGRSVSDSVRAENGTLLVAASPFSARDGQAWALVVCADFGERYIATMSSATGRDIMLLMGDEIVACSNPDFIRNGLALPDDFLDSVTHKLDADVTQIEREGAPYLAGAIPVLDFDEWDIKGYVGVLARREEAAQATARSRLIYWSAAAASLVMLAAGLAWAVRDKQRCLTAGSKAAECPWHACPKPNADRRRRLVAVVACSLLPFVLVILVFSGILVPNVVQELNGMASLAAGAIVKDEGREACRLLTKTILEGGPVGADVDAMLERIGRLSAADVTVFRSNASVVASTLSEADQEGIDAPSALFGELDTSDVAASAVKVRGATNQATAVALRDDSGLAGWILLTVDSSVCQNRITGYKFAVLAMAAIAIAACGVCLFVITNTERGSLLRNTFVGYSFVAPSLIHLIWWGLLPLVFALYLAFHSWSIVTPARPFVGFANFREVLRDHIYWNAMKNTVVYLLHIPFGMALSMAIALALNRQVRGITVWRAVYYLPAITSSVVTSIMWKWMYNPEFGLFNYLLGWVGLGPYPWLTRPGWAMLSLIIMTVWQNMGQNMLIFLAGLQGIPSEYYEAASLDGAGAFGKFMHITLPLLKPTTFFILVTSVIGSFQVFTPVFVLTGGGPLRSTDVVVYRIYQTAWVDMRMGYASAQAWVLFAIILAFTAIQFRLMAKEIRYV